MNISIAIDGPAGAGKSTIARMLARTLGYIYVDTGAVYRTVGLYVRRKGITKTDRSAIVSVLPEIKPELRYNENGEQRMFLNGEDVSSLIRTPEISEYASAVASVPEVRAYLLDLQREFARTQSVVMDGRDIGTVVLPNADVKIFLTASPEVRAKRRWLELKEKGTDMPFEQVLADVNARDYADSHRETAPLRCADDAVPADTGDLTIEESLQLLLKIVRSKTVPDGDTVND